VLGLIYIFVTAKPISLRRLSLLFFVTLIFSSAFLGVSPMKHQSSQAIIIASSITALAWSLPLIQVLCATVWRRRLSLRALTPVSGAVLWTYGLGLATLLGTIGQLISSTRHFMLGSLFGLAIVAIPIGFALYVGSRSVTPLRRR
jgi:hypothetical protein